MIIIKILKNVTNIVVLAVKLEKSKCKRLNNRGKQTLSTCLLETLAASFEKNFEKNFGKICFYLEKRTLTF